MRKLAISLLPLLLLTSVISSVGCGGEGATTATPTAPLDSDGDGWTDAQEQIAGTNPYKVDTDADGHWDPHDTNPLDPRIPEPLVMPTPEPIPAPGALYLNLGQWAESSKEVVTVSSANRTSFYMSDVLIQAPALMVFVIVDVTVTNVGDSPLYVSPDDFELLDSWGYKYTQVGYKGEGWFPTDELPVTQLASGKILFVVSELSSALKVTHDLRGKLPVKAVWQLPW